MRYIAGNRRNAIPDEVVGVMIFGEESVSSAFG
jgi:hypothetical protein